MGHEMNVPLKLYVHKVALCVSTVHFFAVCWSTSEKLCAAFFPSTPAETVGWLHTGQQGSVASVLTPSPLVNAPGHQSRRASVHHEVMVAKGTHVLSAPTAPSR